MPFARGGRRSSALSADNGCSDLGPFPEGSADPSPLMVGVHQDILHVEYRCIIAEDPADTDKLVCLPGTHNIGCTGKGAFQCLGLPCIGGPSDTRVKLEQSLGGMGRSERSCDICFLWPRARLLYGGPEIDVQFTGCRRCRRWTLSTGKDAVPFF